MMKNLENLSERIKKEREKQGLSIEKVHQDTKIPVKFIRYIEEGKWDGLPSKFHIKGYTKLYLSYLNLEISIDDFFKEEEEIKKEEEKKQEENTNKNLIYITIWLFMIFLIECIWANFLFSSLLK